jgi:hypothetical protein
MTYRLLLGAPGASQRQDDMPDTLRISPRMPQAHPARLAGSSDASISAEVTWQQSRAKSQAIRFQ